MRSFWILIFLLLASVGCTGKTPSAADKVNGAKAENTTLNTEMAAQSSGSSADLIKGKVLERLDASSYSYLRLLTASGEIWAAVPQTNLAPGAEVIIKNPAPMGEFESKTLKRKFDKIYFGTLEGDEAPTQAPASADSTAGAPKNDSESMRKQHGDVASSIQTEPIRIDKAPGPDGRTIAEIFAQKSNLKDRTVAVRGKVVKVNSNIMGKTWIHLRDGTGERNTNTDDLTITTLGAAAMGDVVLVKGKIHTDRDFGMGYTFSVILEDATVAK